ncbi:MAG: cell division protein FtsQ [Bacteroidetes bacterium]|nr:cell division protein FtsQ [Bacteroidota bacterium]HET6245587.1 cell division protein FtsQ [Bacteroidia bacterium]
MMLFKKIAKIFFWLFLLTGLIVILSFVWGEQQNLVCKDFKIVIEGDMEHEFIDEQDIRSIVKNNGDSVYGQSMASIDIVLIEKLVQNNPFVSIAEVFKTISGEVKIIVKQRNPIIRVFSSNNDGFYIDEKGSFMPLSQKYAARVLMASGNIPSGFNTLHGTDIGEIMQNDSLAKKTILDDLYILADFINRDDFWKAQIQQIYVDMDQQIELIPRVGSHRIILGDIQDLEEKLERLMIFYKEGLSKTGWNEYETINLKYKNQIVCTKI